MSLSHGPTPSLADNTPGSAVCPPWLLLLDDPTPDRAMVIGRPDHPAATWFADAGTAVDVRSVPGEGLGTTPVDLVVIESEAPNRARHRLGLTQFLDAAAASCRPGAAIVVPYPPTRSIRNQLARHGFTTVRPVRPILADPGRRTVQHGFVAIRSAASVPTGPEVLARPPRWLERLTEGQPWAPGAGGWSIRVPGAYPSQKAVVVLRPGPDDAPTGLIKLARHPRFNDRLENEYRALRAIAERGGPAAGRAPAALDRGTVAGLALVVEEALAGRPFLDESKFDAECPLAADAVRAIGDLDLGATWPGSDLAGRLTDLHGQFVERFRPDDTVARFLEQQIDVIGRATLPAVTFHGDLGTWNLFAEHGRVRILDWESVEDPGPPIWDLAYFLRSYLVRSGRRRGLNRDRAISRHLLGTSPLNATAARWVHEYAHRLGLAPQLVEPLFHTCWMHRAVKEAARLSPGQSGHYGPLCAHLVHEREAPGLRRLVGR